MYGIMCSKPDLMYAVSKVSRFMANPSSLHWEALKWILRYLRGSFSLCLKFQAQGGVVDSLQGYVDSDFAGSLDTRKPITEYIFTLYGTAMSWKAICNQ